MQKKILPRHGGCLQVQARFTQCTWRHEWSKGRPICELQGRIQAPRTTPDLELYKIQQRQYRSSSSTKG